MPTQIRNDQLVDLLAGDFQKRHEPNFAWANAISIFTMLPGLRGFWPMSAISSGGNARDVSGAQLVLTYTGNPAYDFQGLAPYVKLDGTGDYLTRADEANLDTLGTEASIDPTIRGMTVGGWFRFLNAASAVEVNMSKWGAAGNRSWVLERGATGIARFFISNDGTNSISADSTETIPATTWKWIVGRFTPSTAVSVWVNGTVYTNTTGVYASLFNSTAAFEVGSLNVGTSLMTGRASLCFLSGVALSGTIIKSLFHQTRALFGVK